MIFRGGQRHEICVLASFMTRLTMLVALAILSASVSLITPAVVLAADPYACPGYVVELTVAKTSLLRRDRTAAVAALRRAQEALAACIRQSSEETAFAACGGSRHGGDPAERC